MPKAHSETGYGRKSPDRRGIGKPVRVLFLLPAAAAGVTLYRLAGPGNAAFPVRVPKENVETDFAVDLNELSGLWRG